MYIKILFLCLVLCSFSQCHAYPQQGKLRSYNQRPFADFGPKGSRSVDSVTDLLKPILDQKLKNEITSKGAVFPPQKILLLALKKERVLEVWSIGKNEHRFLKSYPILAASGKSGPKYRRGDRQVPEGFYRISFLNANSSYHLSMKINYPNKRDRKRSLASNVHNLGGDIFIHGSDVSIGCIAIGDLAIEELFYLSAKSGRTDVLIAPYDFRVKSAPKIIHPHLYTKLGNYMIMNLNNKS